MDYITAAVLLKHIVSAKTGQEYTISRQDLKCMLHDALDLMFHTLKGQ